MHGSPKEDRNGPAAAESQPPGIESPPRPPSSGDEVREIEERLRTLINTMAEFIVFKDGEGRWLEANDSCLRLFQLEGKDYRGRSDRELADLVPFHRDTFAVSSQTDEAAWKAGSLFRTSERIPLPDGSVRMFQVVKVPVFHPDGRRKSMVVVGRDVTERKGVKEALQRAREELKGRVEECTAELARANAVLRQEFRERRRQETGSAH